MKINKQLRSLTFDSVKCLGICLKEIYGNELYQIIEQTRLTFKKTRNLDDDALTLALNNSYKKMHKIDNKRLYQIGHSFSLMLELINCCEMAYRRYNLRQKNEPLIKTDQQIIFVLTSHPTEARSKNFLEIMDRISYLLENALIEGFGSIEASLVYLLKIAIKTDIAKEKKPQVRDEAFQIYNIVLKKEILDEQINLFKQGITIGMRTWAGGDKDGHPGVGLKQMLESLSLSRGMIVDYLRQNLILLERDLDLINFPNEMRSNLKAIRILLNSMRSVKYNDGKKIRLYKKYLKNILDCKSIKELTSIELERVKTLSWIYPALVVPLEMREDSGFIKTALTKPKDNISKMLVGLKKISNGYDPKWYVRGLIVSMCQEPIDLINGIKLVKKYLGSYDIPVVPLFENLQGLSRSLEILKHAFSDKKLFKNHKNKWNSKFEVMVGYSDSSKENGVLPARVLLEKTIHKIDRYICSVKLKPVFFHGSGGSISRGGGSTKEQISWWPKSSLEIFKMTVQGESIQRNLSNPEIIKSQVLKIINEYKNFKTRNLRYSHSLINFTQSIQTHYKSLVGQADFQTLVYEATPYQFLNHLKLGSRPTKRSKDKTFSLRAIPWILCWTQSRLLLPVWWGIGSAWSEMSSMDKKNIVSDIKKSPLLSSFIKHLGFTLEKIEFGVIDFNIQRSNLSHDQKKYWIKHIKTELNLTEQFFKDITGHKNYTWYRPWLSESIVFRSSMIHPLNVIQRIAVQTNDPKLLRLSVTGISSGMLTTG